MLCLWDENNSIVEYLHNMQGCMEEELELSEKENLVSMVEQKLERTSIIIPPFIIEPQTLHREEVDYSLMDSVGSVGILSSSLSFFLPILN